MLKLCPQLEFGNADPKPNGGGGSNSRRKIQPGSEEARRLSHPSFRPPRSVPAGHECRGSHRVPATFSSSGRTNGKATQLVSSRSECTDERPPPAPSGVGGHSRCSVNVSGRCPPTTLCCCTDWLQPPAPLHLLHTPPGGAATADRRAHANARTRALGRH